jgi:hypothetical protein
VVAWTTLPQYVGTLPIEERNRRRRSRAMSVHRWTGSGVFEAVRTIVEPDNGLVVSYEPELQNLFMQAGVLARKVLQRNAIADLPMERPTRFTLVAVDGPCTRLDHANVNSAKRRRGN